MSGSFPSRYQYNSLTGQFIPIYGDAFAPFPYNAPVSAPMFGFPGGGDVGASDPNSPMGAPSTGDFGRDVSGFAQAAGPALGGMAIGGLMGGPAGAVVGATAANMAQGLAEALGLSTNPTGPVGSLAGVMGNVAQTQMGMQPTSNPVDAISGLLGFEAPPSAMPGPVSVESLADVTAAPDDVSMSMAETQDQTGVGIGEASQGEDNTGNDNSDSGGDAGDAGGDAGGAGGGDGDGSGYRFGGLVSGKRNAPQKAVVHGGEYVLRAEAVKKYGRGLLDALNERRVSEKRVAGLLG